MPQIRLECSSSLADALDTKDLFRKLHELMVAEAGATLDACKSRVIPVRDIYVAGGDEGCEVMVLEIGLLEGRSQELLAAVGEKALALVKLAAAKVEGKHPIVCTARIFEMAKAIYFK